MLGLPLGDALDDDTNHFAHQLNRQKRESRKIKVSLVVGLCVLSGQTKELTHATRLTASVFESDPCKES